ncbi:MAG: elongation factor 1-beta [Nitrososphaerota archaeon]
MAKVAIIVEIMPEDPDMDLDQLVERIRSGLPQEFELKHVEVKPVAFGLKLLKAMFVLPEREGSSEILEKTLSQVEGIQEVNIVASTRI